MAEVAVESFMRHEAALDAHKALERRPDATLRERYHSALNVIEKFQLLAAMLHCMWPLKAAEEAPDLVRASLLLAAERTSSPTWWATSWPALTPESRTVVAEMRARVDAAANAAADAGAITTAMFTARTNEWSCRISRILLEGLEVYEVAAGTDVGGATKAVFCARAIGPCDACVCCNGEDDVDTDAEDELDELDELVDPEAAANDAAHFAHITAFIKAHLARNGGRPGEH
jgi:hypothetical protein